MTDDDIGAGTGEALAAHGVDACIRSGAAQEIERGAVRVLYDQGVSGISEFALANGRRADIVGLTVSGEIWIVEIKSGTLDFRADRKWNEYREYCDRFFFAVRSDFPREILPVDTGHILADRFGGEIVQMGPLLPLGPTRRKAVTLRLARVAAMRLSIAKDAKLGHRDPIVGL